MDPCPGTCGQNAQCQVVNHLPSCSCLPFYTGDPYRYCNMIPPERKLFLRVWLTKIIRLQTTSFSYLK